MRKVTINEIDATVGLLAERSLKKYGNYAYSMGVASTILTELIDQLPAKKKSRDSCSHLDTDTRPNHRSLN